ncbi:amidohydrolase family protein [Niabella insulamsoli]|uniref:amidohydrolase family protein n=1 Tax=Niabella insulamsoli TaxID=3144874 RepID=UPI0031FD206C
MKALLFFLSFLPAVVARGQQKHVHKIFDVHLHGSSNQQQQIQTLQNAGIYKVALSTSWNLQNSYRDMQGMKILFGLMLPCPGGKVPYSLQQCFDTGHDWPPIEWVESQIKSGNIDYFGEILNQYCGISPADTMLYPYYRLAQKYNLPVGIHTGGAGPGHGSALFKMDMGNPSLLKTLLAQFPKLKIWIMHAGDQYYKETINVMRQHQQVYADISVISNPDIVPAEKFSFIMKSFVDAGLTNRLMFGTDNGDIQKVVQSVEQLDFLSAKQKKKLYYKNAERFFKGN